MAERTLGWLHTLQLDVDTISPALALIRRLGRPDLAAAALAYIEHESDTVRLSAAETLLTMGSPECQAAACEVLRAIAMNADGVATATAAVRALAIHAPVQAEDLLASFALRCDRRKLYLQALGWCGRLDAIPTLIEAVVDPNDGDVAAVALALITGSEPQRSAEQNASLQRADVAEAGDLIPSSDAEPRQRRDAAALLAWWRAHNSRFDPTQRYLAGRPVAPVWLRTVLRAGPLPWRALAAEHLQRLTRGPLFPTDLHAAVQRALFIHLPR